MKLASYIRNDRPSYGVVTEAGICDVPTVWPDAPPTLLAALEAGPDAMNHIRREHENFFELLPDDEVDLLAPIPRPPKVLGLAVNYAEHHDEIERHGKLPEDPRRHTTPRPFLMPATVITGPGAEVPWPAYSRQVDHEVELAVVIGRTCSGIGPAEAKEAIAGYTVANDISARSVTYAEGRSRRPKDDFFDWLHGKWADGFLPTGPWLVTADEVPDPQALGISLCVNGERRQDSNTKHMIFDVFELVSFCSQLMTLTPGDIIATGTPSGVGKATGKWLAGGDEMTCEIEGVGRLTNTISQPPQRFYMPCRKEEH